jgi:N-acetylglucosaminyldiphosphoundecaprenol N-acetyl-beta-D-mannosaminyltransferase
MKILGVKIDNLTIEEALQRVGQFMADDKQHYIVTPNPEFLVQAQKDKEFQQILNQADLSVPDGIGLIFASWFLGQPLKQRLAGVDLMEKICHLASQKNWPVFLLGGREGVAEKTAENLKKKYQELQIQGLSLRDSPQRTVPEGQSLLFVAFGAPKQEKWIAENLKKMPSVKLAMGVGGAFDFIAGRVRRAPKILRQIGLEWFWRFIQQPWRVKRIFNAVIVFPGLVIKSKIQR